jgi:hypothetical protein
MAVESKPLFHPEVMRQQVRSFVLPEHVPAWQPKLRHSNTWVAEAKRPRGKKRPLTVSGLRALREEYTRTIAPARARAAETLTLERTLSDLVNQAYALSPVEIELLWETATHVHFPRPQFDFPPDLPQTIDP